MVNPRVTEGIGPERALALRYAPPAARPALAALMALDARLGAFVKRASDPTIGLMRLAWWNEALTALDAGPPPAEPVLIALATAGVGGRAMAGMTEAWGLLLDGEPLDAATLALFGRERGGRLFAAAAALLGEEDARMGALGEGWALADLGMRMTDPAVAAAAKRLAGERLDGCFVRRWPARLRALGALGLLARSDLAGGTPGAPGRVGRLLLHRVTGW